MNVKKIEVSLDGDVVLETMDKLVATEVAGEATEGKEILVQNEEDLD